MKVRGTVIQGALAVAGLSAAYATWQREPERAAGEVVVLEATRSDLQKARFEDDKGWVEVWRGPAPEGAGDKAAWLKLSAREPAPPSNTKAPERELRGNDAAVRLLDALTPLRASRALGVVEPGKLKEFGLAPADAPDGGAAPAYKKRTLAITARGDTRTFTVGSPPGLYATYIKDDRDGRVYLLGGSVVSDLENASARLSDRTLHGFKAGDYDGVTVEAGGKSRELVALPGDSPASGKLASKKTADKPDETARNWHDKLFRSYPSEILGKGEKPSAGEPQIALKVTYASKGAQKGFIEVGKIALPPPATPPPAALPGGHPSPTPPQVEYWARTEHTAGWVKLGFGIEDVLKEAEKIAAAE
jgi:hypothetical protein